MSYATLPKEQQSAYQRWEMASFGDDRPGPQRVRQEDAAMLAQRAEQLALRREEARQEGHAAGLSEGYAAGLAQGRAQADQERAMLLQIAGGFGSEVANANELIAADLLRLALDVAKAMLKTALNVRPEMVIPVINEAIRYLPTLHQPALLFLNPIDAELVNAHMGNELVNAGWRVIEDMHMERGGCRVETASNQIDATAPTRWQRIAAALGNESEWLDT
ncbi:MAG: fliH [Herminiimonas sp.]|nr:fliH [Herminiimonas sp.]